MEKMASARPWPVVLLACAALVAALAAAGVAAPRAALADEPVPEGIVISLGEAAAREDGSLVFDVSSYRDAGSGEVVELDEPFTVTVPDAAQ